MKSKNKRPELRTEPSRISTLLEKWHGDLWLVLIAYALMVCLVNPAGDFPLNDDWSYAHLAKRFGEKLLIMTFDMNPNASVVGQMLTVFPFIRMFGFSHEILRGLTILMACLTLVVLRQLLVLAGVRPALRLGSLLTIVINPIFVNLSLTYMTEVHGYMPPALGILLWFRFRKKYPGIIPYNREFWLMSVVIVFLCGFGFWTRQLSTIMLPALLAAIGIGFLYRREYSELRRFIPIAVILMLMFGATVGPYYLWDRNPGKAYGNVSSVMETVSSGGLNLKLMTLEFYVKAIYFAVFFLPLLILMIVALYLGKGRSTFAWLISGIIATGLLWAMGSNFLTDFARPVFYLHDHIHGSFPYISNLIYNTGVGPVTLTDVYLMRARVQPDWSASTWKTIECLCIAIMFLWAWLGSGVARWMQAKPNVIQQEMAIFFVVVCCLNFVLCVQALKADVFDRYWYFTVLFAPLFLALIIDRLCVRLPTGAVVLVVLLSMPLAWFTLAGNHDYFAWNRARWTLVQEKIAEGVPPLAIDGGYEVDGWFQSESGTTKLTGQGAYDPWHYYASDYIITMTDIGQGYKRVREIDPGYWLVKGPTIKLQKRGDR